MDIFVLLMIEGCGTLDRPHLLPDLCVDFTLLSAIPSGDRCRNFSDQQTTWRLPLRNSDIEDYDHTPKLSTSNLVQ